MSDLHLCPKPTLPEPVNERLPGAADIHFEFVVSDADYCTQAGGIAPTYAQALSEGQHYLAQCQQDGPHTLELRRVEVLPPGAFPVPDDAPLPTPVPVSERLPGDALCWWYEPDEDDDGSGYGGSWTLLRIRGAVSCYTHWLPFHALPLPSGEVQA